MLLMCWWIFQVMHPSQLSMVICELPPLLNECDLHIAQLTLTLLTSVAQTLPSALDNIGSEILPEILVLVKSPLLQGAALASMLDFFQALVQAGLPGLGFRELVILLRQPVTSDNAASTLHKQVREIKIIFIWILLMKFLAGSSLLG